MKILMVYPEYPDTFWSFKRALAFISKKAASPPLGLLTVASLLPDHWEITLKDLNITQLKDSDITSSDSVWISAMTIQKESAKKVITRCKSLGIPSICGGPLFSARWKEFPDADHILVGEGEVLLPSLVKDLEQGSAQRIYQGSTWADLAFSPIPRWNLIRMKDYASMSIQFSRGCPYDCDFCDISLLCGKKVRTKTTLQVISELEDLYERGWRDSVFFVDDNFISNRKVLKEQLLPAVITWMKLHDYPFLFNTQASIDMADDDELITLMTDAGFNKVFIGIETPSDAGLSECDKTQNRNRDLISCVRKLHSRGLEVQGGFIVGFDSDTAAIFTDQAAFIQGSSIVTAMVGILQAMKGTRLYKRLEEENRLIGRVESGNNTSCSINFLPRMDLSDLVSGYKHLVSSIYSPASYYRRVREFLRQFNPKGPRKFIFHPVHVKAFVKSLIFIGIAGKERIQFWKLMAWTLFNRPHMMPYAITYAIYGYHYRRVSENIGKETVTEAVFRS